MTLESSPTNEIQIGYTISVRPISEATSCTLHNSLPSLETQLSETEEQITVSGISPANSIEVVKQLCLGNETRTTIIVDIDQFLNQGLWQEVTLFIDPEMVVKLLDIYVSNPNVNIIFTTNRLQEGYPWPHNQWISQLREIIVTRGIPLASPFQINGSPSDSESFERIRETFLSLNTANPEGGTVALVSNCGKSKAARLMMIAFSGRPHSTYYDDWAHGHILHLITSSLKTERLISLDSGNQSVNSIKEMMRLRQQILGLPPIPILHFAAEHK